MLQCLLIQHLDAMVFLRNQVKNIGVLTSMFVFYFISLTQADLFRFQADAPLSGFLCPMFNAQGQKVWICQGEQVNYLSESKIKMLKMCITFFSPEDLLQIDMVVRSDKAVISLPSQSAQGKTLLTITNPNYTILGEHWQWEGRQTGKAFSRVYIGKNATVMFYD